MIFHVHLLLEILHWENIFFLNVTTLTLENVFKEYAKLKISRKFPLKFLLDIFVFVTICNHSQHILNLN